VKNLGIRTSENDPIRVDFVAQEAHGLPGRLGLTIAPGKKDLPGFWDRDLDADLHRLREHYGADVLVSLLEKAEYKSLGIEELTPAAAGMGIEVLRLPIPDVSVPASLAAVRRIVRSIVAAMAAGRTVVIHCRGGLGRSGLVGACCLVACGRAPAEAISAVREARPGAVETSEQERFVSRFADLLRKEPAIPRPK
jgi:protein-tyrosine phosphatase